MEEAGEVENVWPEEHAAGGAGAEGEAEQPLEWRFGPPPEPPGVSYFCDGWEEDSGEYDGGEESQSQAVKGRERTQWDGMAAAEEAEEEV